jgi:hypothetical protein
MAASEVKANKDSAWWLRFVFACMACAFGGWLLVAILAMLLLGYRLFDQPYQSLIGCIVVAICGPLVWRCLK